MNYPIKLTNKLAHLNSLNDMGDFRPTQQSYQVKENLTMAIDKEIRKYRSIKDTSLPELNELIKQQGVNGVLLNDSI